MKKRLFVISGFVIFLVISFLLRIGIERNFTMSIESELGNQCVYIINDAVQYALAENGSISDVVSAEKTDQGVISYLSVDSAVLNQFSLDAMKILEDSARGLSAIELKIPLGNLFFSQFFSGKGPMITIEAYPVGGIGIDFESEISSAGINQVVYHMDMRTQVQMETIFGFRRISADIDRRVPVCDVIIVGNVPETYANLPAETDFLNLVP